MTTDQGFHIKIGSIYRYTADLPQGYKGFYYRVLSFVLDVPAYQEKVLVRALDGPDKGLLFTCSPANFSTRYEPEITATPEVEQPVPRTISTSIWA